MSGRIIRRRQRQSAHESAILDTDIPVPDQGSQPDDVVLRREQWHTVATAVHALSERCRQLIWYLYYEPDMPSYEEIARRMGLAEGSIGPIRGRCLAQLKKHLQCLEQH